MCQKAFTRRLGGNIPLFGMLVDSYNHSKYETKPLREALQAAFTADQYLFGGQRYDQTCTSAVKVAVTTTLLSMSPAIVANYNRQCDDKRKIPCILCASEANLAVPYQFQRTDSVDTEMKIWEA
jgi:hypothetical protein